MTFVRSCGFWLFATRQLAVDLVAGGVSTGRRRRMRCRLPKMTRASLGSMFGVGRQRARGEAKNGQSGGDGRPFGTPDGFPSGWAQVQRYGHGDRVESNRYASWATKISVAIYRE